MGIINSIISKFVGNKSEKDIKVIQPYVDKILESYSKLQTISNDDLRKLSADLKVRVSDYIKPFEEEVENLKNSIEAKKLEIDQREDVYRQIDKTEKLIDQKIEEILDEILPEAFAIVKETAKRFKENEKIVVTANDFDRDLAAKKESVIIEGSSAVYMNRWIAGGNEIQWDMVHYDVQLFGGVALHKGNIAEMATGEGKTLVATLPVFLNALAGRGVHIVTVNNYLSKRDSEWMGPMYEFHGLSVDCIDKHRPNSLERKKAYYSDITFGTNNEFGFDYLRDNMAFSPEDMVQRKHHYAIVDEVDSVLIDDARTPLIISGPTGQDDNQQLFHEFKPKVEKLLRAQRDIVNVYLIEAKKKIDNKETEAEGGVLLLKAFKGLPKNKSIIKYLSEEGIKTLLHKTENIYLAENSKRMPEIADSLYFVIDEKNNNVDLSEKGINLISSDVDEPDFFILPNIGNEIAEIEKSGLSDSEKLTRKDQLIRDYAIKSERVHTINQLLKAYALFEKDVEYVLMNNKVKIVDEQTGRIMEGRRYSDGLHQAIEAKENVKVEAATQTVATITLQNYFRMYHKLSGMTGTAETEAGELWDIYKLDVIVIPTNVQVIRKDHHDLVYKTKKEKYNAVIDEIKNLIDNGRPVLVGTTSVEISELLSRMLKMRGIQHNVLNAKLHQKEAEIVAEAGHAGRVTIATNMAGRGTDIKLTPEVKKAGGLAIIGTERHESRRVDRQLRGRSGRQGDPGSSQFFVCLEDDLMRLFGSDRIAGLMDKLGLKEGEVIQHPMISKSIERAQKKVEENHFGVRKRLLEYDDVMNAQREVIYTRRKHALHGDRLGVDIANIMSDVCDNIVNENHGLVDFEDFKLDLIRFLSVDSPVSLTEYNKNSAQEIIDRLYPEVLETYKRKCEIIARQALPVIKDVYARQSHQYTNIVVPVTDGQKVYQIITNLEKAANSDGDELVKSYQKSIVLANIDEAWKEHLREMDDLKQSVQNASYEQKDPLLIYKLESFNLFKAMLDKVNKEIISIFMKGHIPIRNADEVKEAQAPRKHDMSKYDTSRPDVQSSSSAPKERGQIDQKVQPVRVEKKVGRNDPCPCGSGKKYKSCHGKDE